MYVMYFLSVSPDMSWFIRKRLYTSDSVVTAAGIKRAQLGLYLSRVDWFTHTWCNMCLCCECHTGQLFGVFVCVACSCK